MSIVKINFWNPIDSKFKLEKYNDFVFVKNSYEDIEDIFLQFNIISYYGVYYDPFVDCYCIKLRKENNAYDKLKKFSNMIITNKEINGADIIVYDIEPIIRFPLNYPERKDFSFDLYNEQKNIIKINKIDDIKKILQPNTKIEVIVKPKIYINSNILFIGFTVVQARLK